VGVSLHLDSVVSRPGVRATARGAFQSLIAILVSLVVLVPRISPSHLGSALVALVAVGLVGALRDARAMWAPAVPQLAGRWAERMICGALIRS